MLNKRIGLRQKTEKLNITFKILPRLDLVTNEVSGIRSLHA